MQTNEGLHWHRGLDWELEEVRASLHRELGARSVHRVLEGGKEWERTRPEWEGTKKV